MSKKIKVTIPDEKMRIIRMAAGYQGYTLSAFLRHAAIRIIRQHRKNLPFLTDNDMEILNGND